MCPCPQSVSSRSWTGGCMSRCFDNYFGYHCRYWGSNAVQSRTDKSQDHYMLCVVPPPDYVVKYCERLTSCRQCSAHLHCGWCDNTCVHKSKAGNCTSYTGHGQNCPVCVAAKSCDTCVSSPGCGWCHSRWDCSSVTLYQPKTCAQRAEGKCGNSGMAMTTQPLDNVTA